MHSMLDGDRYETKIKQGEGVGVLRGSAILRERSEKDSLLR